MSAARGRDKHNAFFQLMEACAGSECPICRLARLRLERYFEGLLYEKVNDPELRRRFRSAGGFCNPHSFQFLGFHDGLAGSILYRDLLNTWLERRLDFPVARSSGVLPDCPACRVKSRSEESSLSLLSDFLEDAQLKQAVLCSDGLCLPHFAMLAKVLQAGRRAIPRWLMDFQLELVAKIVRELDSYLESCNFTLAKGKPALSREQELAWKKAIHKAAGFPAAGGKG